VRRARLFYMTHFIYLLGTVRGLAHVRPARNDRRRFAFARLEQLRLVRTALDCYRGRVAVAGDRLDDLDPDPLEAEVRD
jgi:hypothetical protein